MRICGRFYDTKTVLIGMLGGLALFCVPVIGQFLAKVVQSMRSGVKAVKSTAKATMLDTSSGSGYGSGVVSTMLEK